MKNNFQTYLLLCTICGFVCGNKLNANDIFSLDELHSSKYTKHYNTLPTVEKADKKIQSNSKFNPFLKKAEEIVTRYDLESYVGLRLIHNHFVLPENKIMVENFEKFKKVPSLITYAHNYEEAFEKKALPSSWIFKNSNIEDDIEIFETSSDTAVREGIKLIDKDQEFMEEIGGLLTSSGLNSLLSLAILKRSSLEPTQEDQSYVEINDSSENKSIVQLWNSQQVPKNTIKTSWSFKGPRQLICLPYYRCVYGIMYGHKQYKTDHQKV